VTIQSDPAQLELCPHLAFAQFLQCPEMKTAQDSQLCSSAPERFETIVFDMMDVHHHLNRLTQAQRGEAKKMRDLTLSALAKQAAYCGVLRL